jgi:hypothetical protein
MEADGIRLGVVRDSMQSNPLLRKVGIGSHN